MEKIILFENGENIEVIIDPTKPLWDQNVLIAPVLENIPESSPTEPPSNVTHRNIEQEALQ